MVDTGSVSGRRIVYFQSFDDLLADAERMVAAVEAGRARTLGNWSVAQILQHVGRIIQFSLDGFPFRYSWTIRWPARFLRLISWRWLIALAFRPGFRNPPVAAPLEPGPHVSLGEAAAYLRTQIARIQRGERMLTVSPVEGPLTHEQWVFAHLRHAELHFSFVLLDG